MIPIQLEIKGLYSYREKQTIDFRQLAESGLFGIFGAVGSGKSSILEAIMLSLYGNTERLNNLERKSMVNLQSPEVYISYEFLAGKNNAERFKTVYSLKRKNKNFDELETALKATYEWKEQKWMPVDTPIEKIVGMKMEHFRQTIIIPQGKFRDFIEQKPKDRADMMKELFGLERFDLSFATGKLLKAVNENRIQIMTQIEGLAGFTVEKLGDEKIRHIQLEEEKKEKEKSLKSLEVILSKMGNIRIQHQQLEKLEGQLREIHLELPEIEAKRERIKNYQNVKVCIQPLLKQLEDAQLEEEQYRISHTDCERWKGDFEISIAKLKITQMKLEEDFQKRGEREAKIRDLKVIIEINQMDVDLKNQQQTVNGLQPNLERLTINRNELESKLEKLEKEEEGLSVPDTSELTDLKSIYIEWTALEKEIAEKTAEMNRIKTQIASLESGCQSIAGQIPMDFPDLDQWLNNEKTVLVGLEQDREKLLQHQGLAAFIPHLYNGEKCPLCGSLEHPDPLSSDFDLQLLTDNSNSIKVIKDLIDEIQENKIQFGKLRTQIIEQQKYQKQQESVINKTSERLLELPNLLIAHGVEQLSDLAAKLKDAELKLSKQKFIRQEIKSGREGLKSTSETIEIQKETFRRAEKTLLELESAKITKIAGIRFKELLERYLGKAESGILEDIQRVQKALDELEITLQRTRDRLGEEKNKQATNLANLDHFKTLWQKSLQKRDTTKYELEENLSKFGFADEKEVRALLQSIEDPQKTENEIAEYERNKFHTEKNLNDLKSQPQVVGFSEQKFQETSEDLEDAKGKLEELRKEITLCCKSIDDLNLNLDKKTGLEEELVKLEKRQAYLKEMDRLFSGSGFVKFVSNIYLRELCQTANSRFMKLTKNSLSLEVDDQNNFWVKDYLNSGRMRVLKSLSGGQTFQASLCLALGLAEKVKSLNRADQSFFFLDEGFGALDKPSLRTVFDTLKTLRHERRIVGIISHVEELQQEIEVFAKIDLDPDRGSQVSYSFKNL